MSTATEAPLDERTPLLNNSSPPPEASRKSSRTPSIIALIVLCIAAIITLAAGFAAPAIAGEYAKQAIVFEPEQLSIESFTAHGIKARIQGSLYLDATRVTSKPVRDLGKAATWLVREVKSGDAQINIYLPGYGDRLVASAAVPPVAVNIRNLHVNRCNIVAHVVPEDLHGIEAVVHDLLDDKLRMLDVRAQAQMAVSSGIFNLGTQVIDHQVQVVIDREKVGDIDVEDLRVEEYQRPGAAPGVRAMATVSAMNPYPASLEIPPMALDVLLPGCSDKLFTLGHVTTETVRVRPKQRIVAKITGIVEELPATLTRVCQETGVSPLDVFVGKYLKGGKTQLYATGSSKSPDTPAWLGKLLQDITVPVPVPPRQFDDPIKNFSLSDVRLRLPDQPSLDGRPMLSATINIVVQVPDHIEVNVDVHRVRATANVFYDEQKLGELDLREWQSANSSRHGAELQVSSHVIDAPLQITNDTVFAMVVQHMITENTGITLGVKAEVDVDSSTPLGHFIVRGIPTVSKVFIKPFGKKKLEYELKDIEVFDSTPETLILKTQAGFENPTEYSASLPFVNVSLWCNGTHFGDAWGSFNITPGVNDLTAYASYKQGPVGRELLSQYLSGRNVSVTVHTHQGSVPGLPNTNLAVSFPLPHVFGKFLRDTTMHVFSSTATFVLFSPISMYVTGIAASAFYNNSEIGTINWDYPFEVVSGGTETPRLPVEWNNNGGLGLIRDALGGTLKLDTRAEVGVKIGNWEDNLWYEASGIGAKIRI